jgi:hypothetical protein
VQPGELFQGVRHLVGAARRAPVEEDGALPRDVLGDDDVVGRLGVDLGVEATQDVRISFSRTQF